MSTFDRERKIRTAFDTSKVLRTAVYIRVSKDEQVKHGFSIPAQKAGLTAFCEQNGYQIVDFYIDEGKSARKKTGIRKEFTRLLHDVEEGKIDHIVFKCIDRWFRNIKEYYKTQEVLDKKGVTWEASEEEYDTSTRAGKMKLGLFLMVAEDESDRTSERIKYVFDNKVKNREAILGSHALPFGFKNEVIDGVLRTVVDKEKAHIIYDLFDYFELTQTKKGAMQMVNDKYGLSFKYPSICKMIENPWYYGHYRGVDDYIWGGSYMTKERWEKLQRIGKKNIRKRSTNRVYIFSGLLVCKHCQHKLGGHHQNRNSDYINKDRKYECYSYRCANANNNNACHCKKQMSEKKIERKLMNCIEDELSHYIATYKLEEERAHKKINIHEIEEEIERLNKMYQKKRIKEEDYDKEYDKLEKKIEEAKKINKNEKRDIRPLEDFLNSNWKNVYKDLTREEKRSLWRSVVDTMEVDCFTQEFIITFL